MKDKIAVDLLSEIGCKDRSGEIETFLRQQDSKKMSYPWRELVDILDVAPVVLIAYGSLLHPESAARTISNTPVSGHPPVVAWGAQRLFNYTMPDEVVKRYSTPLETEKHRAALNTVWTGRYDDVFNGRAIEIKSADLEALRVREKHYDLMPVAWLPWMEFDSPLQLGFALCAREDSSVTDDSLLPHQSYLSLCATGARIVGSSFEELFFATTYLADRSTTVR